MAANDSRKADPVIRSYANTDPELAKGTPVSLRELRALRERFEVESDPRRHALNRHLALSEAERRRKSVEWESRRKAEEGERGDGDRGGDGRGSEMVGKDRPRPELKPKHERGPVRETFNQAWFREARKAREAEFNRERAANDQSTERGRSAPMHSRALER